MTKITVDNFSCLSKKMKIPQHELLLHENVQWFFRNTSDKWFHFISTVTLKQVHKYTSKELNNKVIIIS